MPDQGPVVKIYQLRVTGFEEAQTVFNKMSAELARLKKQKQDLDKTLSSSVDASKVDALTKKQQELTIAVLDQTQKLKAKANELKALETVEKSGSATTDEAVNAYYKLITAYKQAKVNSELMEEQFGKESAEAREAAKAFAVYESELKQINALRKNSGVIDETKAALEAERIKQASLQTDRQIILNKQAEEKAEQQKITTQKKSLEYQIAVQKEKLKGVSTSQAESKIAQQAANEYYQLGQALRDAELKYKNLALTQGFGHEQTQVALKDALAIRGVLDKVDQSLGNYQRSVGNYGTAFNGLNNSIQQILREAPSAAVSLNTFFLAISNNLPLFFDEIAKINAEQKAANIATREASVLAKEQAVAAALQAGATAEAAAAEGALAAETVIANAAQTAAPGIMQRIISSLFSLQSGLTLGVLLLTLFGSQVIAAVGQMIKGTKSTLDFTKAQKDFTEELEATGKSYNEHIVQLEILNDRVNKTGKTFNDKKEILKDFNKEFGETLGVAKDYNEVEKILREKTSGYIQAMFLRAEAQAALNLAIKEQEKVFEENAEAQRIDIQQQQDYNNLSKFYSGETLKIHQQELLQARKRTDETKKQNTQEAEDRKVYFKKQFEDFQHQADAIDALTKIDTDPTDKAGAGAKTRADALSVAEKNALNIIDSTLQEQIAAENERVNEIQKLHNLSYDEEKTHLQNLEKINVNALNSKIDLLSRQKKLNTEELAQLADFKEKRSAIELETSKQIQEIEKKRFADQDKALQASLDQNIARAKEAQKAALANPDVSNIDKARADLDFIDTEIVAYKTYYNQLLDLNSNYNKESLQKVRDHINDLLRERTGGVKQELLSTSSDLQAQGAREITDINIQYQKRRKAILDNEKLTEEQKNRLIDQLSSANNITILTKELATLDQQLKDKFQLLLKGLVSEEDYEKLHLAAISKAGDLEAAIIAANNKKRDDAIKAKPKTVEQAATKAVDNLFNVDENSAEAEAVGAAVAGSFSLATDAMHSYYDAERARIQQSLDMNLQRLDVEEQQVKARAQSQAEIDSIDKQYAAKKLAAQKVAGEQTKKTKKAELKIALVTELANDAVAAAAYPFPFSLAIFGAMSALALGRYTLGLGQINAQQFAFGGNPDMTTTRGGRVKGRAHSKGGNPFIFKGRVFEDEVDELNIIRTKGVNPHKKYQLSGTHLEIASALNVLGGGLEFQRGAKVRKFDLGGAINSKSLGATLEAPVFVPSSNYNVLANNGNKEILEELKNLRKDQQKSATEISNWKDRFQVAVNATDITKIQKQQIKQAKVGTL